MEALSSNKLQFFLENIVLSMILEVKEGVVRHNTTEK